MYETVKIFSVANLMLFLQQANLLHVYSREVQQLKEVIHPEHENASNFQQWLFSLGPSVECVYNTANFGHLIFSMFYQWVWRLSYLHFVAAYVCFKVQ
jgi:hypothetical protein